MLTLVTLFSVILENYKSFFTHTPVIELTAKEDAEGNDSGKALEKDDLYVKEKHILKENASAFLLITKSKFYISHSNLLPPPYTSLLEMPPERA